MFKSTEFIGISLEGDSLKVARVVSEKNQLRLVRVDELTLVEPIKRSQSTSILEQETDDTNFEDELDADLVFGLEDDNKKEEKKVKSLISLFQCPMMMIFLERLI